MIFFIISGFIMVYVARRYGSIHDAVDFFVRRLVRIAPLYWICTLAMVVLMVFSKGADWFDTARLAKSLAFIPYNFSNDRFRPVLMAGWTLDYEIFFYGIFAIGLVFKRSTAIFFTTFVFIALAVWGIFYVPASSVLAAWSRPIILLFLIGALIGQAWLRWGHLWPTLRPSVAWGVSIAILAIYIVARSLVGEEPSQLTWRPFDWSAAGLMFALALLAKEPTGGGLGAKGMLALGDSSYSLYLTHQLTIAVLTAVWNRLPSSVPAWPSAPIMIGASVVVGWLCYQSIEKPLMQLFHRAKVTDSQGTPTDMAVTAGQRGEGFLASVPATMDAAEDR